MYLKTNFILDLIPLIPFHHVFEGDNIKLFYSTKILRLSKGFFLLGSNQAIRQVKLIFHRRLLNLIKNDPDLASNMEIDNNNIKLIIIFSYGVKIFKVVVVIMTLGYFLGILWYILCDLTLIDPPPEGQNQGFILEFGLREKTPGEVTVIVMYFAITTLSTVGFGDFNPRSNFERALCASFLFIGVGVFSYIMSEFTEILKSIWTLNEDVDQGDELTQWFGLIKRFNQSKPVSMDFKLKVEEYFDYRWRNDKNLAVSTDEDKDMFKELPLDVKVRLYSDFLFNSFIMQFKKFLEFPKEIPQKQQANLNDSTDSNGSPNQNKIVRIKHAYYNWDDLAYQNFIIEML